MFTIEMAGENLGETREVFLVIFKVLKAAGACFSLMYWHQMVAAAASLDAGKSEENLSI